MQRDETRLDAAELLFFKRELESIDTKIYDIKFPLLKGRTLVPKILDVGEWDTEYTYRQYETSGRAKIIAGDADDLPSVNAVGREFTSRVKLLGDSYSYSIADIRAAAAKGKPLSDLMARAARRAIEELIDELIAFGSAEHQMSGFVNNAAVDDTFVPATKTAGGTTWLDSGAPNATAQEMVADINSFVATRWGALKEAEGLGGMLTVVLPSAEYAYLASEPMGDNADKTALKFLTENNPFLEGIVPWHKLDGAGESNANRMIVYLRNPEVLGSLVPLEYSPQNVEQRGINFKVPVIARCGGTVIRYPVAVAYADGI